MWSLHDSHAKSRYAGTVMHIRCPHCRNPIELIDDSALSSATCPSCGSSFSLIGSEETQTFTPETCDSIGHFQLIEKLGVGAFGTVWMAHDSELDRRVAVKIPRKGQLSPDEAEKFLREARAAAQLNHPGIVNVYEVGREDDTVYIISDLIDGLTLADWLTGQQPTPREAAELCRKIAEALHHAHERGVTHRDLKPANVMIDREGEPHLMDFGLARREAGEITMTMDGQVLGTPAYMSPEQARGDAHRADARSDVYSLGVVLFESMTGETPFRGNTRMLLHQLLTEDVPSPRKLNGSIPRDLETICLKCLHREPSRRYRSAKDLEQDLTQWLEGKPIQARRVTPVERAWLWCRRRPALVGGGLAALLVFVAVSLIFKERQNNAEASRLVEGLLTADTTHVSLLVDNLKEYESWVRDDLSAAYSESPDDSNAKLHAALAMLPHDMSVLEFLRGRLLRVSPTQFAPVRDLLRPHHRDVIEHYWSIADDTSIEPALRFRAACALADYDPQNKRWSDTEFTGFVAESMINVLPSQLLIWRDAMRPVRTHLSIPLSEIYRDATRSEQIRSVTTETLADYLADEPNGLFDMLADADGRQFPVIYEPLTAYRAKAIELANAEIAKTPAENANDDDKEAQAILQANSAVLLYKLNVPEQIWPLLSHSPDPRVRSHIIHRLGAHSDTAEPIAKRYTVERDVTVRSGLLMSLGEFNEAALSKRVRDQMVETILSDYQSAPDSGLHSAAEWLLRRWGHDDEITAINEELARTERSLRSDLKDGRSWYLTGQGQTFVVIDAGEFTMGAPMSENHTDYDEPVHRRRIGRRFAISTREVTRAQWRKFMPDVDTRWNRVRLDHYAPTDDSAMPAVSWYKATQYCNWLSQQEGIPEDQWCYLPNDQGQFRSGMKPKPGFTDLTGYRLPTEPEWEYACRAGTTTSRYYGQTDTLVPHYARFFGNGENQGWPTAQLKPNNFGLFDMLGNLSEWCFDERHSYPSDATAVVPDKPKSAPVGDTSRRIVRGGSFYNLAENIRSADRVHMDPGRRVFGIGFRPARTLPSAE